MKRKDILIKFPLLMKVIDIDKAIEDLKSGKYIVLFIPVEED